MFKKIVFLLIMCIIIFPSSLLGEEETTGDIPTVTTGEKQDYLTIRNNSRGDSQENITPYNGYYTPGSTNEPFKFRTDENIVPLPENRIDKDGYSGYYNPPDLPPYTFPAPELQAGTPSPESGVIDINENSFFNSIDIKNGGLPVWKEIYNANVTVDNLNANPVKVFEVVQPQNHNMVGYNIEFPTNREDELAFTSFILQFSTMEVQLLINAENSQEIKRVGKFNLIEDEENKKKIMIFTYKEKEIITYWKTGGRADAIFTGPSGRRNTGGTNRPGAGVQLRDRR